MFVPDISDRCQRVDCSAQVAREHQKRPSFLPPALTLRTLKTQLDTHTKRESTGQQKNRKVRAAQHKQPVEQDGFVSQSKVWKKTNYSPSITFLILNRKKIFVIKNNLESGTRRDRVDSFVGERSSFAIFSFHLNSEELSRLSEEFNFRSNLFLFIIIGMSLELGEKKDLEISFRRLELLCFFTCSSWPFFGGFTISSTGGEHANVWN